jgi:hypothetical protein
LPHSPHQFFVPTFPPAIPPIPDRPLIKN